MWSWKKSYFTSLDLSFFVWEMRSMALGSLSFLQPASQRGYMWSRLHDLSPPVQVTLPALGFSDSSAGKRICLQCGDLGSIPGLGRSPGEGKGYPLQYFVLENSMGWQRVRLFLSFYLPWVLLRWVEQTAPHSYWLNKISPYGFSVENTKSDWAVEGKTLGFKTISAHF